MVFVLDLVDNIDPFKAKLTKINLDIESYLLDLAKKPEKPFKPIKVFVSFDSEASKRECVKALCVNTFASYFKIGHQVDKQFFFEGRILDVKEPPEVS